MVGKGDLQVISLTHFGLDAQCDVMSPIDHVDVVKYVNTWIHSPRHVTVISSQIDVSWAKGL